MTSWIDEIISSASAPGSVFLATETEFLSASASDSVGRTVKLRIVRSPKDQHLANPFAAATRRKGKRAGSIFDASIVEIGTEKVFYAGEAMLLNWASGPAGDNVTLLVNNTEGEMDGNPFMLCKRPSSTSSGTRFMAVFLNTRDNDEVIEAAPTDPVGKKSRETPLSVQAAMMLKHSLFGEYLREKVQAKDWTNSDADKWLKECCGIKSKSELVSNKNAASICRRIMFNFSEWSSEGG